MADWIDLGSHDLLRPQDAIYRWIADRYVVEGNILDAHWPTSQWRNGLSCDWGILSGPDETARRLRRSLPAFVLRFSIQDCHDLNIKVHHCPVVDENSPDFNLAHCLLYPPESQKAAIRRLRDELYEKAKLLEVHHRFLNRFLAFFRKRRPRHKAALRYISNATQPE